MAFACRISTAFFVGAALFASSAAPAAAGAWTLAPGEAKIFASGLMTQGDHYYDATGKKRSRGMYRKWELQFYGEYGLAEKLTLFGALTAQKITANDGSRSRREGLGRSEIGARFELFERNGWVASVQGSGLVAGARRNAEPAAVGESDDQLDGRFMVGRNITVLGKPGYVDFEAGYRKRFGDPSDEIRVDTTVGVHVTPKIDLLTQTFVTYGVKRWSGRYPLAQRIVKCQGGASYALSDKVSIYGVAFFTPFALDALDERGGQVGVAYRF